MTDNVKDQQLQKWEEGLEYELNFWRYFFNPEESPQFNDARHFLVNPDEPLIDLAKDLLAVPPGGECYLLDVGCGPISQLGLNWPNRTIRVAGVDPLADEYNMVLDEMNIIPRVRTVKGEAEKLTDLYLPNTFDLTFAANCLDHSYDPMTAIRQSIEVLKPGHWFVMNHYINEAEHENYAGLHQWNFHLENGRFVIWNQHQRVEVEDELKDVVSDFYYHITPRELAPGQEVRDWLQIFMKKKLDDIELPA